jgi:hypothetical protein
MTTIEFSNAVNKWSNIPGGLQPPTYGPQSVARLDEDDSTTGEGVAGGTFDHRRRCCEMQVCSLGQQKLTSSQCEPKQTYH